MANGKYVVTKRQKPQVDIRDVKPTIAIMNLGLSFNGGSLSSEAVGAVWGAVIRAFEEAAHKAGLGFSWNGSASCRKPEVMARRIERDGLHVEMPPAAAAVDPVDRGSDV